MTVKFIDTQYNLFIEIDGNVELTYEKNRMFVIEGYELYLKKDDKLSSFMLNKFLEVKVSEIPNTFRYYSSWEYIHSNENLNIHIKKNEESNNIILSLKMTVDLTKWNNPYSILEFNEALRENTEINSIKPYYLYKLNPDTFIEKEWSFKIGIKVNKVEEENLFFLFENAYKHLKFNLDETTIQLNKTNSENVFIKLFNFPSGYENICSQYLMWFGEFLKNLGINANVSTEQTYGQTALIINPEKNNELLIKIEHLFYQYLQLPYVEILPPEKSLTQQEMHAYHTTIMQVQHLATQIQMKDSVIASYQASNTSLMAQLKPQSDQPLLMESLKDEKKYEFFNGAIKIPAKQHFGKNKNITFDMSKLFSKSKD
ncbi:MAG: hypothetical protein HRT38_15065 [Alteromonadaceae bacterium]|nr:hypothetical protein [Alteromonadaceae bacterium]